jgi:cobalt-zinc-cadmium efflux system membrane fusion protein
MTLAAACSRSDASGSPSGVAAPQASNFTLPPAQRDRVKVATVAQGAFHRSVRTTGTVAFDQNLSTHVVSPISGTVMDVLAPVGTHVKAGDALARVASPDFAADVSAYRKAVTVAANLRRVADADKKLLESGNIGRRELEQADADATSAEADRMAAIEQLRALGIPRKELDAILSGRTDSASMGIIHAPMEGTVVENLISPGELLQQGSTDCFTIARLDEMWIMAEVFGSDLSLVKIGAPADVTLPSSPKPIAGKVDYVADLVDPNTRAVAVRIVAANPDRVLKKDAYVNVAIQSADESRGLLVPVSALLLDSESLTFVFVANPDGSFSRRRVTAGARSEDRVEIEEGLHPGDHIVTEGGLFVQFAEDQ